MRLTALWPSCWPSSLLTAGGPASPPLATCGVEVFLEVEMGPCFRVPLTILQTPSVISHSGKLGKLLSGPKGPSSRSL